MRCADVVTIETYDYNPAYLGLGLELNFHDQDCSGDARSKPIGKNLDIFSFFSFISLFIPPPPVGRRHPGRYIGPANRNLLYRYYRLISGRP